MVDRSDPQARERALIAARQDQPFGISADETIAAIEDFLASIGGTCPECTLG